MTIEHELSRFRAACAHLFWSVLWNLFLSLNLLHTSIGQTVERTYLRAALPNIRAFEIEPLPVTGVDVPLDELVEAGPEQLSAAEQPEPFAITWEPDDEAHATEAALEERARRYAYGLQTADVCRNCHKDGARDGARDCEQCAFDELSKGVGT